LSPWKYSLKRMLSFQAGSVCRRSTHPKHGRRPVHGGTRKFQEDPHWRDLILFFEYFHGDNGAGLGASHQTGWTGIVADLIIRGRGRSLPTLRELMEEVHA